jgi:hypothetical protein
MTRHSACNTFIRGRPTWPSLFLPGLNPLAYAYPVELPTISAKDEEPEPPEPEPSTTEEDE